MFRMLHLGAEDDGPATASTMVANYRRFSPEINNPD
jgi:hypothetical protein